MSVEDTRGFRKIVRSRKQSTMFAVICRAPGTYLVVRWVAFQPIVQPVVAFTNDGELFDQTTKLYYGDAAAELKWSDRPWRDAINVAHAEAEAVQE